MSTRARLAAALCLLVISSTSLADTVNGAWSPPFSWPLIAVHAVLTPDGRVLSYGTDGNGNQTGYFIYDVWDPSAGITGAGHLTLPNVTGTDIFCSSQVILPQSGDIFIAGGDNLVNGRTTNTGNYNTNIFSPASNSLARGSDLNLPRWYSTSTTLLDGEIYIQGGSGGGDLPEVRDTAGGTRLLTNINTSGYNSRYPRNFVAPDGRIFGYDVVGRMYYVVPTGSGAISIVGQLPGSTGGTSSAAMFEPGRILQMGGVTSAAIVIDINGPAPVVTSSQSMSSKRQWVTATLLPDGRVLGTGGSEIENVLSGVNNSAEIWNPATGLWTVGPSGANARLYHSTALLLPDASVLVAGGGAPGPLVNLNAEIYYPSYLFDSSGARAARPQIISAPDTVMAGDNFPVGYSGAASISRVSLIRTGSITHSFNMDQRQLQLPFSANGALLSVQLPTRPGDLPPGYYLLFVLNESGVPSVARTIRVGITAAPPPTTPDATAFGGGFGGAAFTLACNANEVLVGVKGITDAYVNQVSPLCTRVNQAGDWLDTPIARGSKGSAVVQTIYTKLCPAKSAISGFRGYFMPYVNQLDLECRLLTPSGTLTGGGTFLGPVGNATGTAQGPWRCPSGNPGYALYGRSTGWINNFGIQCRQASVTVTNTAPVVANPGAQTTAVNSAVDLGVIATDPEGNLLTFSAGGLPAGLVINASSGRISGAPTVTGSYAVTVTASDGLLSATTSFGWTVTTGAPFVLDPLTASAPKLVGAEASYTASSHGGSNVLYSWFFDDGTAATPFGSSPTITHTFARAGIFYVTVTATSDGTPALSQTVAQTIHLPATTNRPSISSSIVFDGNAGGRIWVVNQDNSSVSVFSASSNAKLAEIAVGAGPRTLAVAPNGSVWVTNKYSATLSVIDPSTLTVTQTIALPYASQPFGIAFAPTGGFAFVALEASGVLLKLDAASGAVVASVNVGANPRHVSVNSDGTKVYVARFITPPLPGEATAVVQPGSAGGEVVLVAAATMTVSNTITLAHSYKPDAEIQGSGVPNYLGAVTLSPDGLNAWVPSKQDNVLRGTLRNGAALNFQNTVRAIASRIDLSAGAEVSSSRVDLDNASLASAAAFDPFGNYLFVALETSREVALLDVQGHYEIFRINVGRAPQGLAISNDGRRLYVNNFMDRTVGVFDLSRLMDLGESNIPSIATLSAVSSEALPAQVLTGKQFFYDARDSRLARDAYLSCASCHNDGGTDGRTWDFTGQGEGLRNTVKLMGRAGAQGFLHWSGNFDEVQDFEGQIRTLAGGTGLMSNAEFNTGTRAQPLGDTKAGVNADLDALAAYVTSLATFPASPRREADGSLSVAAVAGREVFHTSNCAQCHGGASFTMSAAANLRDIGTLKPSSGKRLGGTLTGIDIPTLRDVWATAPYLHDGSAPTLGAAVLAHTGVSLSAGDLTNLVAYLEQIDGSEPTPPPSNHSPVLTNPGNQSGAAGVTVNLAITATDADGDVLIYSATGLPPPLLISSSTGRITGIPSAVGTYTVTVTVRDSLVSVSQTFSWTITVRDIIAPTKLSSFTAALVNGRPNLVWGEATDNVGVAGYIVYRSTDATQGAEIARTAPTARDWTDTVFVEKVKYTYSLKAFDAAGNLGPLTSFKYLTPSQSPSTPTLSGALSNGATGIPVLNWTAATDNLAVAGYLIARSTNGAAGTDIANTPSLTFSDTTATPGILYTYNVRAYDAAANQGLRSAFVSLRAQ